MLVFDLLLEVSLHLHSLLLLLTFNDVLLISAAKNAPMLLECNIESTLDDFAASHNRREVLLGESRVASKWCRCATLLVCWSIVSERLSWVVRDNSSFGDLVTAHDSRLLIARHLLFVGRLWQLFVLVVQIARQFATLSNLFLDSSLVSLFDLVLEFLGKLSLARLLFNVFSRLSEHFLLFLNVCSFSRMLCGVLGFWGFGVLESVNPEFAPSHSQIECSR